MKPVAVLLALLFGLLPLGGQELTPAHQEAIQALVRLLGEVDDPQFQLDVLKGMSEGFQGRRSVPMPADWEEVYKRLSQSPNAQVRATALSLSLTFGSPAALASLRATLSDGRADLTARTNALAALLRARDPHLAPVLQALLREPTLRGPVLRGLAGYDDPRTPGLVLAIYPTLGVAEKRDALNTLVSRVAFARPLLAAVGDKTIPSRDLTADIVQQLRNLRDPEVNRLVGQFWGVARETDADVQKEIGRFKKLIQSKNYGDPRRGRLVYERVCQQCHALFDEADKVGPDITGSNRADLDYILENILDPNAVIPNDYRTSNLETKDDRFISGIVTRQDHLAVTIVTATETHVIPRNEIASLTPGELSLMPEGLLQPLTEGEVRDLLAYLRSPQQVPPPADGEGK